MTGITIAIPTHNRARLLGRTLDSLTRVAIPPDARVDMVIVNNNCTDDTSSIVAQFAPRLPFPVHEVFERQPGLNAGRNRALDEAAGDHVVYFDDDVLVDPGWIEGYLQSVREFAPDCVVGPVSPSYEVEIPPYATPKILESLISSYSRKGDQAMLVPADVAHEVPGCNFGVRRDMANAIGRFAAGLDRSGLSLLAGGDREFGERLVRLGRRVAYQPRCAVLHIITAEKLDRDYLRRRWHGTGVTQRMLVAPGELQDSVARRFRQALGVVRLFAAAAGWKLIGQQPRSFERELEARRALAFLMGR
jgi:glucosyl-dolichyl phosphate glucuronosyltransferase